MIKIFSGNNGRKKSHSEKEEEEAKTVKITYEGPDGFLLKAFESLFNQQGTEEEDEKEHDRDYSRGHQDRARTTRGRSLLGKLLVVPLLVVGVWAAFKYLTPVLNQMVHPLIRVSLCFIGSAVVAFLMTGGGADQTAKAAMQWRYILTASPSILIFVNLMFPTDFGAFKVPYLVLNSSRLDLQWQLLILLVLLIMCFAPTWIAWGMGEKIQEKGGQITRVIGWALIAIPIYWVLGQNIWALITTVGTKLLVVGGGGGQ